MEQTQYRKLSEMVPNPKNPRKWKDEKEIDELAKSIRNNPDFFEARPILLSDRTGVLMIIGGERRWEAARHLGLTQAPSYLFHGLTEEREDEIMNRDNAHSGVWDEAKLQSWGKEQLQSWGVDVPKWDGQNGLSSQEGVADEKYNAFVDKFKTKLTTDDCYTPPKVYDVVKNWVDKNITPLKGRQIIRPFFPGGDYEHYNYPEGGIVLDNPPFSILAKILDFYLERNIPFFLFCNGLTSLCSGGRREGVTTIIIGEMIEFENGAKVSIGFFTNLCPDVRVWLAADLAKKVDEIQSKPQELPMNKWDIHIKSAALLGKIAKRVNVKIMAAECEYISTLSDGTRIYGGGIILSDRAAKRVEEEREKAEEEREKAEEERKKAEEERKKAEEERVVNRRIGDKEREIIERLNGKNNSNV